MAKAKSMDELRKKCWDEAFHSFGTAEIFRKRASKYRRLLRSLTFLGVAVPTAVGGIVLSFGVDFKYTSIVILIASILGLAQLILSLWSLVAKWDDTYAYSLESLSDNGKLSSLFQELAESPPNDRDEFRTRYDLLQAESRIRTERDNQQIITDKEKRYGMRASLRQFRRECVSCKQIPTSMEATDCDVCGNL